MRRAFRQWLQALSGPADDRSRTDIGPDNDSTDMPATAPARRDIGMVFQSYALFPHMTVEQNIAFPLRMRRMAGAERNRNRRTSSGALLDAWMAISVYEAVEAYTVHAFHDAFPADLANHWCGITEGRDFPAWERRVDPPHGYSPR